MLSGLSYHCSVLFSYWCKRATSMTQRFLCVRQTYRSHTRACTHVHMRTRTDTHSSQTGSGGCARFRALQWGGGAVDQVGMN